MTQYEFELIRLGQELKDLTSDDFLILIKIRRACGKFHRLCEDNCNLPDFDYAKIEKQKERIKSLFKDLSVGSEIKLDQIQQDPRGMEVRSNNYFVNCFIYKRG